MARILVILTLTFITISLSTAQNEDVDGEYPGLPVETIDNGGANGENGNEVDNRNGEIVENKVEEFRPCPPDAKLAPGSKCKNVGDMYAFGSDCKGYYVCNMFCQSVKFQCGPGTAFDEIAKICNYPHLVTCNA